MALGKYGIGLIGFWCVGEVMATPGTAARPALLP